MITQLPCLSEYNVKHHAGLMLDKCGRGVTVNAIRLHMGTAHMACDPKGVVDMTTSVAEVPSLLDMEALERSPELIKELREALRWGRPVTVSSTKIVVEPLEGLDDRRCLIWGEPETWNLAQEILGEVNDPVERPLVQVGELKYVKGPFCCI